MDFKYVKNKDWYIPDIQCSVEGKKRNIGKYGRLREKFLKENRKATFDHLVASEELVNHLVSVDKEARKQINMIISELAKEENVDETLKASNHILWMQKMNNIKNRAEEIVIKELIYS